MLNIAICDDDPAIRSDLQNSMQRYKAETGLHLQIAEFTSGDQLLQEFPENIDLLILDIQMPGRSGLDTARAIRKVNQQVLIIFFTNYVQYALEGYEVQAYRFLLKPLDYDQFTRVVGSALQLLQNRRQNVLLIQTKERTSHIPIDSIQYIETYKGHVIVHTLSDKIECYTSMKEMEHQLEEHSFFRCHTAFLVPLKAIRDVTQRDVHLYSGEVLPLSRHRRSALKEAITIFWGGQFL